MCGRQLHGGRALPFADSQFPQAPARATGGPSSLTLLTYAPPLPLCPTLRAPAFECAFSKYSRAFSACRVSPAPVLSCTAFRGSLEHCSSSRLYTCSHHRHLPQRGLPSPPWYQTVRSEGRGRAFTRSQLTVYQASAVHLAVNRSWGDRGAGTPLWPSKALTTPEGAGVEVLLPCGFT